MVVSSQKAEDHVTDGVMTRWVSILLELYLKIVHSDGDLHQNADALSGLSFREPTSTGPARDRSLQTCYHSGDDKEHSPVTDLLAPCHLSLV